jgi:hypothetical protein
VDFWAPLKGLVYEADVVPEAAAEQATDVLRARTGRLAAAEDRTAARARVVRGAIVRTVERRWDVSVSRTCSGECDDDGDDEASKV